jgi:hypothetical protein
MGVEWEGKVVPLFQHVYVVLSQMLSTASSWYKRNKSIYQFVAEYNPCIYNSNLIHGKREYTSRMSEQSEFLARHKLPSDPTNPTTPEEQQRNIR